MFDDSFLGYDSRLVHCSEKGMREWDFLIDYKWAQIILPENRGGLHADIIPYKILEPFEVKKLPKNPVFFGHFRS